ncbi:MAG: hypothetical protein ACE5KV_03830 [Thermoplasmata archaeon]
MPPDAIFAAWDLFFRGTSLEDISRHLEVCWSLKVSAPSILEWVRGYFGMLRGLAEQLISAKMRMKMRDCIRT